MNLMRPTTLAALCVGFGTLNASALSSVTGVFHDAVPESADGVYRFSGDPANLQSDAVFWGRDPSSTVGSPVLNSEFSSYISFLSDGDIDVNATTAFSIGQFKYANRQSAVDSGINAIKLQLSIDGYGDFDFQLQVVNVRDIPGLDAKHALNADLVRFVNPSTSVEINGRWLTLAFDLPALTPDFLTSLGAGEAYGWEPDPNNPAEYSNGLRVIEGGDWEGSIIGRFTDSQLLPTYVPPFQPVPESGATLAFLSSAFCLLSAYRSRRVNHASRS